VFGFLLLWEWLRPVEIVTDTTSVELFVLFVFISFVFSFFQINRWLSATIKLLFILYCLNDIYYLHSFIELTWIKSLLEDVFLNIELIFQAEWSKMTDIFRSLLFFILLWLMTYLIHYWLMIKRKIFLFFFLTLLYIAVLDTFTPYDAKYTMIRTVIVGFGTLGILAFFRVMDKEKMTVQSFFARKWMIPLSVMLIFSTSIGILVPKAGPQWPDPVPFIKSLSDKGGNGGGGSGMGRVGYSVDDSQLGGPFLGDDRVVFEARTNNRHYWRVETKDVYTGKGWETSGDDTVIPFDDGKDVPIYFYEPEFEYLDSTATINVSLLHSHIVYPQGLEVVNAGDNHSYLIQENTERIKSLRDNVESPLQEYSLTYSVPEYKISSLKGVTNSVGMRGEELERYTQLPDDLPERVKELAEEITADKSNWYDKAKAIEDYFNQPQYVYDQFDVAIPDEEDDYVDQFLFETMRGYCDNFSTSMVVMLRSVDIPARWVKGYTDGEFKGYDQNGIAIYEITNNNAHSWVEVYFPNVGWVPFEPTKGFDNNLRINYEIEDGEKGEREETESPPTSVPQPPENDNTSPSSNKSGENVLSKWWDYFNQNWYIFFFTGLVLLLVSYVLYQSRIKWIPYWLIIKYRKNNIDTFTKAYLSLIKQLRRFGFSYTEGMTLREFAKEIDSYYNSNEMSVLTNQYEKILYRGKRDDESWESLMPLWKKLLRQTTS